ncbi:diguanylate cyclase DgcA [uncultured Treponema sp.]|uniref:diguanylate cyclase DgcA n=1 Tax=uncultured Treponema sp. TaxID=162155 RepID=UPI0025FFB500|nr:diguanylate cyclase DgcA [uncultured Treponema sp.]
MSNEISEIVQEDKAQEIISEYEKKIYDLQQLLEISRSLCSTLEFSKLIESILYTCMGQFHVLGAGLFVLNALDADSLHLDSNYNGIDPNPNISYIIPISNPVVNLLETSNKVYTVPELVQILPESTDLNMITTLKPSLIIPLVQHNHLNGILLLGERITLAEDAGYSDYEKEQLTVIASLASIAINNAALIERSSTDMMTHLKLKYFFFNVLADKLDNALAGEGNLSVIMFDIDFFKRFNDTYGHACGDYVLQTVAKIIKSNIREKDMASRYGGEEFTVLLNETSTEDAMIVAERIRSKVEQFDFCYEDQHVKVTISIGVSTFDVNENPITSPKMLVDQADQALYISKRSGRNRVTFADPKLISEVKLDN